MAVALAVATRAAIAERVSFILADLMLVVSDGMCVEVVLAKDVVVMECEKEKWRESYKHSHGR
jgi:hypothetical protein